MDIIRKSDMNLIYLPVLVEFVVTSGLVVEDDVEEWMSPDNIENKNHSQCQSRVFL